MEVYYEGQKVAEEFDGADFGMLLTACQKQLSKAEKKDRPKRR